MRLLILLIVTGLVVSSCSTPKYGCPTSGKAVGAEAIATGDQQAIKLAKKAPKFDKSKF